MIAAQSMPTAISQDLPKSSWAKIDFRTLWLFAELDELGKSKLLPILSSYLACIRARFQGFQFIPELLGFDLNFSHSFPHVLDFILFLIFFR